MLNQDLSRFAALMVVIGEIYNKSLTQVVIGAYWNVLKPFRFEEVERAVYLHLGHPDIGQYLPKPADIIMAIKGNSCNQALQAWTKVMTAIQRVGCYTSLAFDDELIHAVIEDMGGWQKLCGIEDKQLPFIAKEFQERYRGYVVRRPNRYPKYLVGIIESQNSIYGYIYSPPVLFGDKTKAEQVMAAGKEGDYISAVSKELFFSKKSMEINTKN